MTAHESLHIRDGGTVCDVRSRGFSENRVHAAGRHDGRASDPLRRIALRPCSRSPSESRAHIASARRPPQRSAAAARCLRRSRSRDRAGAAAAHIARELPPGSLRAPAPYMLAPFPHRYCASLCRTFASRARIEAPPRPPLHGGPSPELDGDVDAWSPEHMLLSSLGLCMLTTFEAFAARDGIELLAWCARVHGTVEQTPEGPTFTSIVLELDVDHRRQRRPVRRHAGGRQALPAWSRTRCACRSWSRLRSAHRAIRLRTADDDIALRPRLPHDGRALHAV